MKNIYTILFLLILVSCGTQKQVTSSSNALSDKQFYKEYSEKLGVQLSGKENRKLIEDVAAWLGTPYKYGGCSKSGTDCSCFVVQVFKDVYNEDIPRNSQDMYKKASKIKASKLKAGDLVFFAFENRKPSHVGIYIGNNKFIHASSIKGVMISDLTEKYFKDGFLGGGRYYFYG